MPTAIDLPARADVAITGGGFAGCATAWALAERGVSAVIREREPELGRYASGRGAARARRYRRATSPRRTSGRRSDRSP